MSSPNGEPAIVGRTTVKNLRTAVALFQAYPADTALTVEVDADDITIAVTDPEADCTCTRAHGTGTITARHFDCLVHGDRYHQRAEELLGHVRLQRDAHRDAEEARADSFRHRDTLAQLAHMHSPEPETAALWPGIGDPLCGECTTADRAVPHPCRTRQAIDAGAPSNPDDSSPVGVDQAHPQPA